MRGRLAPLMGIALGLMGVLVPVASGSGIMNAPLAASPVGTAFTYQGQLKQSGVPTNGACDMQFSLFDSATPTTQIGSTQTKSNVGVSNGLFTIQDLDFGNVFDGNARWLQVAVRCPAGSGGFTTLSPLTALTPTPYAIHALSATTAMSANTANSATTAASFTGNLAGDVTGTQGATTVARLQGRPISATLPSNTQVLQFSGGQWTPSTLSIPAPGLSEYAYIYNTTETFTPAGADFTFGSNGPTTSGISHPAGTPIIVVAVAGIYKISFIVISDTTGQVGVSVNGVVVPGSSYDMTTTLLPGQFVVQLNAGDVITLRNDGLTLIHLPSISSTVNASVVVEKLN